MGWSGPITNRQHITFLYYLGEEVNKPDRNDFYLMQLTAIVAGLFAKSMPDVNKFKIEFKKQENKTPERKMEDLKKRSMDQKGTWLALAGLDSEGKPLKDRDVKVAIPPKPTFHTKELIDNLIAQHKPKEKEGK
jgi:hypothetical protein